MNGKLPFSGQRRVERPLGQRRPPLRGVWWRQLVHHAVATGRADSDGVCTFLSIFVLCAREKPAVELFLSRWLVRTVVFESAGCVWTLQ